jgi:GGDEF domain-containing protein
MKDLFKEIMSSLSSLSKSDDAISNELQSIEQTRPELQLPKHVFKDLTIPDMGNLHSFSFFDKQYQNSGVYIILDSNDFGSINEDNGYKIGDEAIKSLMGCISQVSSELGLKAFRMAGAQALVHAPSSDKAVLFCDKVQKAIKSLPLVNGKHKMSVSIGMGYSKERAENALKISKEKLCQWEGRIQQRINQPGAEENVFHSLLNETPNQTWQPLLGYSEDALHEEGKQPFLPNDVKSPLKPDKG